MVTGSGGACKYGIAEGAVQARVTRLTPGILYYQAGGTLYSRAHGGIMRASGGDDYSLDNRGCLQTYMGGHNEKAYASDQ